MIHQWLRVLILCLGVLLAHFPARADVLVFTTSQLEAAVGRANAGGEQTILLADGIYDLNNLLHITGDNITIRGRSGNRDAVMVRGQGMGGGVSHVFLVRGSHFTARDMTIGWVANHAVQVQGEENADHAHFANLRIVDAYEQLIKVSYNASSPNGSDHGIVENCLLEYSAGVGPQYYIGGVDAHQAKGWIIRQNIFKNIASPAETLAEHAVHFWSGSEDTLVEANQFLDCDRGIGLGMGDRGHVRGVIRNNMIFHSGRNSEFADVGIDVQSSAGVSIYNNTIFFQHAYPNAIECRFAATTGAFIANNLTNRAIAARDGAAVTATHNVVTAKAGWFVDPAGANLRLASAVAGVVDQGTGAIPGLPALFLDFDGGQRPLGSGIDIGAHEYGATPPRPETFTNAQWITSFYVAYWDRVPDAAGHAYWLGKFTRGELTIPEIAENFALSAEAKAAYPYFNAPETATDAQRTAFVRAVYRNLLDREAGADDPGVVYWVGELRSGRTTPGAVIGNIIYAAMQAGGADWETIRDKVIQAEQDMLSRARGPTGLSALNKRCRNLSLCS